MAAKLPFINAYGTLPNILHSIIDAQTPSRFTQDFLSTKLGFKSSSARAIIPLFKKIGFLQSDGSPTDLYKNFRSDELRGQAMAQALKMGYGELFEANEYAHNLENKQLEDTIVRVTGSKKGSGTVKAIAGTFKNLCEYANFDRLESDETLDDNQSDPAPVDVDRQSEQNDRSDLRDNAGKMGMNLSYTINLNLPETKDPEVFKAIFDALNEKLLK